MRKQKYHEQYENESCNVTVSEGVNKDDKQSLLQRQLHVFNSTRLAHGSRVM